MNQLAFIFNGRGGLQIAFHQVFNFAPKSFPNYTVAFVRFALYNALAPVFRHRNPIFLLKEYWICKNNTTISRIHILIGPVLRNQTLEFTECITSIPVAKKV